MGQTSSIPNEPAQQSSQQTTKVILPSQEEIVSNKVFALIRSQKQAQLKQQLNILASANQDVPTSNVQLQDLVNINQRFYEPEVKPQLAGLEYNAEGFLTPVVYGKVKFSLSQ